MPREAPGMITSRHMPQTERPIADVNVRSHTFAFISPTMTTNTRLRIHAPTATRTRAPRARARCCVAGRTCRHRGWPSVQGRSDSRRTNWSRWSSLLHTPLGAGAGSTPRHLRRSVEGRTNVHHRENLANRHRVVTPDRTTTRVNCERVFRDGARGRLQHEARLA
jgi:hypothetical protein